MSYKTDFAIFFRLGLRCSFFVVVVVIVVVVAAVAVVVIAVVGGGVILNDIGVGVMEKDGHDKSKFGLDILKK